MARETVVLITLVVYKLVLIAIGFFASRRTRDEADFYLGGRGLGPWVAAISASASSSSAWTLLGVSGAAFSWGLGAVWLFPACVGGFLLNWFLVAPRLRRYSKDGGDITLTEVLAGSKADPLHRTIMAAASLIIVFSLLFYVASQFQASGKTFESVFGLSFEGSVLLGGAIIVFYTMLGGFWAVSITDTLQGLVMATTSIILPVAALIAVGGPSGLVDGFESLAGAGFNDLFRGFAPAAALGFVFGVLGIGLGYPGQPHVVNRFMALRDEASLKRARVIALTWAVVVYGGMLILGWCGRILFGSLADNESVFFAAANELFPSVLAGVMVAGVLSAIMSTADSQLLVAASSVTHDMGFGKKVHLLAKSRLVVFLISAFAVALAMWGSSKIFDRVLFAWTAMGSAFGPPLLILIWRGTIASRYTLAAMVTGFSLSVLAYSFPETRGQAYERVFPFLIALGIAWMGTGRSDNKGRMPAAEKQ